MLLRTIIASVFALAPAIALTAPLYLGEQEVPDDRLDDVLQHCRALYAQTAETQVVDDPFVEREMEVNGEDDEASAGESGAAAEPSDPDDQDQDTETEDNEAFVLGEISLEDCKQAGLVH